MISSGLKHKIKYLYKQNRRQSGEYTYTIPSQDTYPYQWLWDSCFAAITMSYFDLPQAKNELRSLVSHQFPNGMLPHMIYWERVHNLPQLDIKWGKRRTSSITQPPLLAEAVQKIYKVDGDITFVKEMLPFIHHFHQFFYRHRDPRQTGLVGLINPDESGEDTSPRFDEALALTSDHTFDENYDSRMELLNDWREERFVVKKRMDRKHWVRDLPFNCILARSLHITSRLAGLCGDAMIADWSHRKANVTSHAIRTLLRDEKGNYISTMRYGEDGIKKIHTKTWALFSPLYAEIATHEEAASLVALLSDKQSFGLRFGVPTVSVDDPSYNLEAIWPWPNWRGPIWFAPHWLIAQGLRKYGYTHEADKIQSQSMSLIEKSGFREFYHPETGEGYGAKGFIWGGLVLDM